MDSGDPWHPSVHGGFRVLPYGDQGDDWLQLDRNYAERSRTLEDKLSASLFTSTEEDADFGLSLMPNRSHLGAVFLTNEGASNLQMLINREDSSRTRPLSSSRASTSRARPGDACPGRCERSRSRCKAPRASEGCCTWKRTHPAEVFNTDAARDDHRWCARRRRRQKGVGCR